MARRRPTPQQTLSPSDAATANSESNPSIGFPRANSPGLTGFFSRPAKWFGRSSSNPKISTVSSQEPRNSTSSAGRKHKISRPTDPRPILDAYSGQGSKSVLDLSVRPVGSLDIHSSPSQPSSPVVNSFSPSSGGLGDLRAMSRRPWSKSADDLSSSGAPPSLANLPQINFQEKIQQYRNRSNSNTSQTLPPVPPSPSSIVNGQTPQRQYTFPTSSSPPRASTSSNAPIAISVSAPVVDEPQSYHQRDRPLPQQQQQQQQPPQSHTRSYSFTPKLSSKLAGGQRPNPASPGRKGSWTHEQDSQPEVIRQPSAARTAFASFGFGSSTSSSGAGSSKPLPPEPSFTNPFTNSAPRPATTLLAPPANIADPKHSRTDSDGTNNINKRASQIVLHTGFINRLTDAPSAVNLSNQNTKAWKPFKMELKGAKLFLYKPPSDKANAIRELFPARFVPPSMEDDEEDVKTPEEEGDLDFGGSGRSATGHGRRPIPGNMKGDMGTAGTFGRRKRAYWGKGRHPDLVPAGQGEIEKGTFEAFVHECVYGTSFRMQGEGESPYERESEGWMEFAGAVLLCLPSLVGRARFEGEMLRCARHFLDGVGDDDEQGKGDAKRIVGWICGEYLRYHGAPADLGAWEEWRTETVPDVDEAVPMQLDALQGGLPTSVSTQGMFAKTPTQSPALGAGVSPSMSTTSPNLGTFSPRPEDVQGQMGSLLEPFVQKPPPSPGQQSISSSPTSPRKQIRPGYSPSTSSPVQSPASPANYTTSRVPWAALERDGLTRDVLSRFDPSFLAASLTAFHRGILDASPVNLTAEYLLGPSTNDAGRDGGDEFGYLFGTDDGPHWLTKFVLVQILGGGGGGADVGASSMSSGGVVGPSSPASPPPLPQHLSPRGHVQPPQLSPSSRTHSRSEVISVWARVAERCRAAGDECSWRAIEAALCARPVARLDKAWKRVDRQAQEAVEGWVYPSLDEEEEDAEAGKGAGAGVEEPRVTVWGGDVRVRIREELGKSGGEAQEVVYALGPLRVAKEIFEGFRTTRGLCPVIERSGSLVGLGGGGGGEMGVSEEDVQRMVAFWREVALEGGSMSGWAAKIQRVEQFMALSLAAEPRRRGLYEPYWSLKASTQPSQTALQPLNFPEPLPSLSLVDRQTGTVAEGVKFSRGQDGQLHFEDQRRERAGNSGIAGFMRGGTLIPVHSGELILVVSNSGASLDSASSSRAPSRPPSSIIDAPSSSEGRISRSGSTVGRSPSIRVKTGNAQGLGLDRKTSMARRSSLPSLMSTSRHHLLVTEPTSEAPPLRVLVQAGTLDWLVDILVHGLRGVSVSVADDNGEMSLGQGMTRQLVVDQREFSKVWWNVFRSFVTPLVFFELLRKHYLLSQPAGRPPTEEDYVNVATARSEVLETIRYWITNGGGAQDALDDSQLYAALNEFFNSSTDHLVQPSSASEEPVVEQAFANLDSVRSEVKALFLRQTMRPVPPTRSSAPSVVVNGASRPRNVSVRDPPDIDRISPEEFVEHIDAMASAAFNNVTEEDLYQAADIFEVQSADRTGWFTPKDSPSVEEFTELQTVHTLIQELPPSSLISDLGQDVLYKVLPPGIRSCIRAFTILRRWLVSKIIAPRLGLRARQARMEILLRAIEISRQRNLDLSSSAVAMEQPCVRSLVEAVLTSAVLSVESRLHHKAWTNVAAIRGASPDSLLSLIARVQTQPQSIAIGGALSLDIGWLIERIVEILASPDLVDAPEGQRLINFAKRRQLCNVITTTSPSQSPRRSAHRDGFERRALECLNNIEREVMKLSFDLKGVKEEAQREGAQAPVNSPASARKTVRPFQRLIIQQQEKNRRDKHLRTRLQKEKQQEQTRHEKREDAINRAMRKPVANPSAQKMHRNKKSMSSLFNFMRPISTAFGADTSSSPSYPGARRSAAELDFSTTGKPSMVLSLVDAQASQFVNTERNYLFQLSTEDGALYVMQAVSKVEMKKWIETIDKMANLAKKRRLTYIGNSPKPQLSDHLHDGVSGSSNKDPRAVFGIPLEEILRREAGNDKPEPGAIPSFIERFLQEVEARGLTEVGIYRLAGATSEINSLKEALNRGESPITEYTDINAVCDVIKSWLRVLPDSVFPSEYYNEIIEVTKIDSHDERLAGIRDVVHRLPQANFDLLRRIFEHLDRVTDFEESNQMTAEALAIVFSPNLLRAPQNDFALIMANMGHMHKLVKFLITQFHVIFDEDIEGEGDLDVDGDADEGDFEMEEELDALPIVEVSEATSSKYALTDGAMLREEYERSFLTSESLDRSQLSQSA